MVKKRKIFLFLLVLSLSIAFSKIFGVLFSSLLEFLLIFIFILLLHLHLVSQTCILIIKCTLLKKISILLGKPFYTYFTLVLLSQKIMKHFMTISDPEAFKLMADGTRRKIVFLLRAKEMTVSQIAHELDITPQTVYHHIRKLVEGNLVEVSREVRVDHLIESYYQATAEVFHFTVGKTSRGKDVLREETEAALKALTRMGFKLRYNPKVISELVDLLMEQKDCCGVKEYEDAVSKLEDLDFLTKQNVQEYAGILSMSDEELSTQDEFRKKFQNLLRSLLVK